MPVATRQFDTVAKFSRMVGVWHSLELVSKAAAPDQPVVDAADRLRTRVATAFLSAVDAVKQSIPLKDLADKLLTADLQGVLQILDLDKRMAAAAKGSGLGPKETSLLEALQDVFVAGARAELQTLDKVPIQPSEFEKSVSKVEVSPFIGTALSFDLLNPEVLTFLSTYAMDLIKEISDDARDAINDVVMNAFEYGGHPYAQAREIRELIGLTKAQARAVRNFRNMLENEPLMALSRELRDHWFDGTLRQAAQTGMGLSQERIAQMTQRYYDRYLKYRAEMIARTETIRAAHMGQVEAWRQSIQQGYLSPTVKHCWVVTHDDRLCEICKAIPGKNPGGVPVMDGAFQTDIGPVNGPPAHPHCRCTTVLNVTWGKKKNA